PAAGTLHKTGAGTITLAVADGNVTVWNADGGILQTSNAAGTSGVGTNANLNLNGGTVNVFATAPASSAPTIGTGTMNIGTGGILQLTPSGAFTATLTVGNLARTSQGTMVINPTTGVLGTSST